MTGEAVKLAHGAGGRETSALIREVIVSLLEEDMKRVEGGVGTDELDDGASIPLPDGRHLVFTADSYTVKPPFFPGGNIGELAAAGTINDLLMMGARPIAMLDAIVVEEGFPMDDLRRIVGSLVSTLRGEGVKLVGGDFKVMPRGNVDGVVMTTAGVGVAERLIVDSRIKPGDKLIVTGSVGEHGAAILAAQRGVDVESQGLSSDSRPLTSLMIPLLREYGDRIRAAQDPTRGGLSQSLNEWASKTGLVLVVDEASIPVREEVRAYTELLGVDPLSLACEGRALLAVDPESADEVLEFIRGLGERDAQIIGEARSSGRYGGLVLIKTVAGGLRILEPPSGVPVPRIC
ncbi:MAG: hydrogenase expression/formation protein HypE [Candidatus Korarchaeota archaeon]|nr:hydrogenase expression/formation protein HypE [Candidatus Korarchaeota archaeon]